MWKGKPVIGGEAGGIKIQIQDGFNGFLTSGARETAKRIVEISPDTVILFGIKAEKNARLFFQCTETLDFDMGRFMESACRVIDGRGGGRSQQAQGGGPAVEKLEEALQSAQDRLVKMIGE